MKTAQSANLFLVTAITLTSFLSTTVFAQGGNRQGPLGLNDPLNGFGCSPQALDPGVKSDIDQLASAVRASNNTACDSLKKDLPDGASINSLLSEYAPNPDQTALQQDQAQSKYAQTLLGYLNNPSTAPSWFVPSQYSASTLQSQIDSNVVAASGLQQKISATHTTREETKVLTGVDNVGKFSNDVVNAVASGCLKDQKSQLIDSALGLAGSFLSGPIGLGVEIGTKVLGSLLKILEARKKAKETQSSNLQNLETEVGLKCMLKKMGNTECNLYGEKQKSDVCTTATNQPINPSNLGDLGKLQIFLSSIPSVDAAKLSDQDRKKLAKTFFSAPQDPSAQSPYQTLQTLDKRLDDIQAAYKLGMKSGIDGDVDQAALNATVQNFDTLKKQADDLHKKIYDDANVLPGDETTFFGNLNTTLNRGSANLASVGTLFDGFSDSYLNQLKSVKGETTVDDGTVAFIKANNSAAIADVMRLNSSTGNDVPNRENILTNLGLSQAAMQQAQASFSDKISTILKRPSGTDPSTKSDDDERRSYFCMALLNLPTITDDMKKSCASASVTVNRQTLKFADLENQSAFQRACAMPYLDLMSNTRTDVGGARTPAGDQNTDNGPGQGHRGH